MRNRRLYILFRIFLIVLHALIYTDGACTFPTAIRGNWVSSEKGTLNFTEDTLWSYPFHPTVEVTSVDFACNEQSGNTYFLQATAPFALYNIQLNTYLCLEFDKISDYKFTYQVVNAIEQTSSERVFLSLDSVSTDMATACNRAGPYETATFNVLVKEGATEDGLTEATCPNDILHTYSEGSLTSADGTKTCSNATMNVCDNRGTRIIQTYDTSCDSSLEFASNGTYICLHSIANDTAGVTYLQVWNNDTTLASGDKRIHCYAFEAVDQTMVATLYPGACLISQTPTVVTAPGIVVEYNTITQTVVESGSQTPYIVAIVFGALVVILIIIVTVCVIIKTKCRCITKLYRNNSKIGHSDDSFTSSSSVEDGLEPYLSAVRPDQPPVVFIARKPIKLGPIIEPYLEPPAKVELLYDAEPRPSSSRLLLRSSLFLSQLSLKTFEKY